MDNRYIICKNTDGVWMRFDSTFGPFLLTHIDGIYGFDSNVITATNNMVDGASVLGNVKQIRNIVITLLDRDEFQTHRQALYELFDSKSQGELIYCENGQSKSIGYICESIESESTMRAHSITISLLCPDPLFSDVRDTELVMAGWIPQFEFPHEFKSVGEELGRRSNVKLKKIRNTSASSNIGITIEMSALGNIKNPNFYHIEQNMHINIGTTIKPLNLKRGDILRISTHNSNKKVVLISNGVEKNINEYLSVDSYFFQLNRGVNSIGYDAEVGREYMEVKLLYRFKYGGV